MSATLIINALVVNEGRTVEADVRVREGRIAQIGQGLTCYGDEELVDAAGCCLLPGLIDEVGTSSDPDQVARLMAGGVTSSLVLSAAAAAGLLNHVPDGQPSKLPATDVPASLPTALEAVRDGRDTLEALVERAVHEPARRLGLRDRGYVREDAWADLVLVDPAAAGSAAVLMVWVNGTKVWNDGALLDARPGQALAFAD